jgi:hypothetical protein
MGRYSIYSASSFLSLAFSSQAPSAAWRQRLAARSAKICVSNNRTEVTSNAVLHHEVAWHYVAPEKPVQRLRRVIHWPPAG